jgi:HTH-type transcriptional regulator/antitoxin MqsA
MKYKDKTITIFIDGDYCNECNEGFHTPKEHQKITRDILLAKRKVDDLLKPDDIKRIRKKVKLTQKTASELLGGGINAFSKYENAKITQPRATDLLLRLLDKNKITLEDLEQLKTG